MEESPSCYSYFYLLPLSQLIVGGGKSQTRISKSETNLNDQIEKFKLGFWLCFGFRYSYFKFIELIWND